MGQHGAFLDRFFKTRWSPYPYSRYVEVRCTADQCWAEFAASPGWANITPVALRHLRRAHIDLLPVTWCYIPIGDPPGMVASF